MSQTIAGALAQHYVQLFERVDVKPPHTKKAGCYSDLFRILTNYQTIFISRILQPRC